MRAQTVTEVARALKLSPSTVRRDVAGGCAGIIRPGEPGRGRGALLDLDAYRRWRDGERDDAARVLDILGDAAADVLLQHGGATRALRRHAAFIALAIYIRAHQQLTHAEPDEIPQKLRTACAVFVESKA